MDFVEVPVSEDLPRTKSKAKKQKKQKESREKSADNVTESESTDPPGCSLPPAFSLKEIKNKQRRHLMFMKLKQEKRKVSVTKYTHKLSPYRWVMMCLVPYCC